MWRKRKGIEPSKPLLAQSFIGFEDRGRHQSGTRFRGEGTTDLDRDASLSAGAHGLGRRRHCRRSPRWSYLLPAPQESNEIQDRDGQVHEEAIDAGRCTKRGARLTDRAA